MTFRILFIGIVFSLYGCSSSRVVPSPAARAIPSSSAQQQVRNDRALSHFIEGSVLDAKNQYGEAILEYQEALRYEPNNAAIHHAIGRSFAELNKPARAAESAREAVRLDPSNIAYRETLARVYVGAFQVDAAVAEYEAITRLDRMNNRVWYHLARLLQPQKPLRSLEIYEMLMDRNGESWDLLLQTADLYGTLGKYEQAAEHLEAMLQLEPSNKALQRQLAETYSKAGRHDDALRILEDMYELQPDDPEVALVLGDLYLDRKETVKAVQILESVRSRPDMHHEVKVRIGVAYFSRTEHDSSFVELTRKAFSELRAAQPGDWRPHWYLGALALNQRRDSAAAASFAEVTRLEPGNADAWWFLGSIALDKGDFTRALQTADQARQSVPNDFRVYLLK
ncbi:MAG: tetratricopeptide repeat protein, partial [Bacteroidota bacterium]